MLSTGSLKSLQSEKNKEKPIKNQILHKNNRNLIFKYINDPKGHGPKRFTKFDNEMSLKQIFT